MMKKMTNLIYMYCFIFLSISIGTAQNTNLSTSQPVAAKPLNLSASVAKLATCIDSEDGRIEVQAQGGHTPYQYIEIIGQGKTERLEYGTTFSKLDPATYIVEVKDALGQVRQTQVTLEATYPAPLADFEITVTEGLIQLFNRSENTGRWSWAFADDQTSYEQSPTIAVADNLIDVCLKASNGCNHTDTYCETINTKQLLAVYNNQELPTAITPTTKKTTPLQLTVYPNPTTDLVTITYPIDTDLQYIELYDVMGQLLQTVQTTSTRTTLSLATRPAGMYILKANEAILKINKSE